MKELLYEILAALGQRADFTTVSTLGGCLGRLLWTVVPGRRSMAIEAVQARLGLDNRQAERLVRQSFEQNGRSFGELLLSRKVDWRFVRRRLIIKDPHALQRILAAYEHRPMVAATAHLGAWELLGGLLNLLAPQSHKQVVVKATHDIALHRVIKRMRTHSQVRIQEHDNAALNVLRNLAKGGLTAFLVDHNCRREDAVFLPFLGRLAAVNIGPALLALRGKALVWPIFLIRATEGRYHLHFEEPLDTRTVQGERQEKVRRIAEFYTRSVERHVLRFPDQWFWMHRRWKTRPQKDTEEDKREGRKTSSIG